VILVIILIGSISLSLDTSLRDPESWVIRTVYLLDWITSGIFLLEAMVKIIAYGFLLNGEMSYLRNVWNILDFTILIITTSALFVDNSNLQVIKVFRMLRVLRPLRLISRN